MIRELITLAHTTGEIVSQIYQKTEIQITNKNDNSVLTLADTASHEFICSNLKRLFPSIPIVSEESSVEHQYEIRKNWECFFLVDPLDGTKEFIQRNGEFTINIALIQNNRPIIGVIHAPALNLTYYAEKNKGAYKISSQKTVKLSPVINNDNIMRVVTSRSHLCAKTQAFLNKLINDGNKLTIVPMGSALKFGLIAESSADIYPRLAPTMEWDTAAGDIIVQEVGKKILRIDDMLPLEYNKAELVNASFIVQ